MEPRLDPEPTDAGRPVPMDRRRALTLLAGAGASVVALAACGGLDHLACRERCRRNIGKAVPRKIERMRACNSGE